MMKKLCIAALLAVGCSDPSDDSVTTARAVDSKGETVAVDEIDLTADNESTYVVDLRDDGPDGIDVVRRNGGRVRLPDWLREVTHGMELSGDSDVRIAIVPQITADVDERDAERHVRSELEDARRGSRCPATCMHCPEDNIFLCSTLCGFGG